MNTERHAKLWVEGVNCEMAIRLCLEAGDENTPHLEVPDTLAYILLRERT